jgi:hypothetical protein
MGWRYSCAAPAGYRAVIITERVRGELRGRGAQLSATTVSTTFNAPDAAAAANPPALIDKSRERGTARAHLVICSRLPCLYCFPCFLRLPYI